MVEIDPKVLHRDVGMRTRAFNYLKNASHLSFSLRTDIKQELKDFLECLQAAVVDVQAELDAK